MMNPMRILIRLVLNSKFLEIISRCCATLSAIGYISLSCILYSLFMPLISHYIPCMHSLCLGCNNGGGGGNFSCLSSVITSLACILYCSSGFHAFSISVFHVFSILFSCLSSVITSLACILFQVFSFKYFLLYILFHVFSSM